ncbi:MAG: pentapeptide repeat-containing protein, partial [Bacteroidetes bacterium]|nr:pentapeptide repeat-containing protein [Bacteroidota bacterium]
MLNSKSIGDKIATARKKVNLSQAELAQQVSISSQAVGKWERGESMPDITTLNRLAEILGVDLNYFSESFQSLDHGVKDSVNINAELPSNAHAEQRPAEHKTNASWDMSKLNLVESDFSGLKNLHEKFSSSNIQRCLFVGSDMSGITISSNNIDSCTFNDSDMSHSQIQSCNIGKNQFRNCMLKETEFYKCNIEECDFSEANLTDTKFKWCNMSKANMSNSKFNGTKFIEMQIQDVVFDGLLENCYFENSAFYNVKFENA